MNNEFRKIQEASSFLLKKIEKKPKIGLILGSGLGVLADEIQNPVVIKYEEIPNFPVSTVVGHAGQLVIGEYMGQNVVAMQGRFHAYEGYTMNEVTLPVYVMKQLGVEILIVTNAAGGLNRAFTPGDLMLITDHINMTGDNPLIGPNIEQFGPRFPDMSEAYNRDLIKSAEEKAAQLNINVQKGVYTGITGPSYMTAAELKMSALLGGDAIGMSTVPEVIIANHCGIKTLGITCITDMAVGDELEPLSHEQVVKVADQARPKFISLVKEFISGVL